MKNFNLIFYLFFCTISFSQELSKKELTGVWEAKSVEINKKMFKSLEAEKLRLIESIFLQSKYSFSKSGLIKIELLDNAPLPFKDEMFGKVYYYSIENNLISVGNKRKASNIMNILVRKVEGNIHFDLVGVLLKVEKIIPTVKLKIDKQELREMPRILPSKPLLYQELNEDDINKFDEIDNVPITPECFGINDNQELKKCVNKSVTSFVARNFNTDLAGNIGLSGRIKITSTFIINKEGEIVNISSEAPHPELIEEATRVMNLLTFVSPAFHNNKPVNTKYSIPIIFQIQD